MHMTSPKESPVTRWLRENRGAVSQLALVADLEAVTGWRLLRENYSKYETGRMAPEPETLARFTAYWAAKGRPGPDFTPDPVPAAAPDLATALTSLAAELAALRAERQAWQRGVLTALAASEGPARAELLAALAPQPS